MQKIIKNAGTENKYTEMPASRKNQADDKILAASEN